MFFLFHYKSSFGFCEKVILKFQIFKFHDVMKCLSINKKCIFLNNLGSKHSLLIFWPVCVILLKKKLYQKILQKLQLATQFLVLFCLQRIRHSLYWKMKILKQATNARYTVAKPLKFVQISMQSSSDSFLLRMLLKLKRAWN